MCKARQCGFSHKPCRVAQNAQAPKPGLLCAMRVHHRVHVCVIHLTESATRYSLHRVTAPVRLTLSTPTAAKVDRPTAPPRCSCISTSQRAAARRCSRASVKPPHGTGPSVTLNARVQWILSSFHLLLLLLFFTILASAFERRACGFSKHHSVDGPRRIPSLDDATARFTGWFTDVQRPRPLPPSSSRGMEAPYALG